MRVVFFVAGGDMGYLPLCAVAEQHEILAIVRPAYRGPRARHLVRSMAEKVGLRKPDPIAQWARARGIQILQAWAGNDPEIESQLKRLRPDLICIATFPMLLSRNLFAIPEYGALNLHPSLLPRHRGPAPLFWIYYHDDRQTGVTVHRVNEKADAGDILCQDSFDLARGFNVDLLHRINAERGASLLTRAVCAVESENPRGLPQNESLATPAPRIKPGAPMVNFEMWDVERVWHFLAGLCPKFREPLRDQAGKQVKYEKVLGYERSVHHLSPGHLERSTEGWRLFCSGGLIRLN
ncbi:MAG TPA: formyltransferase family protein [Terriglobia bacterium]|nr:formyltransferase family protein [Terriglobia bacterium]